MAQDVKTQLEPADFAGLWYGVRDFTPLLFTDIRVYKSRQGWQAIAGPYTVDAVVDSIKQITFSLPGNRGYFRGALTEDRSAIVGHWVQPRTQQTFAEMASPVELENVGADNYIGSIHPLPDRMTMYISIEEKEDGRFSGVLRNPEANIGRFYDLSDLRVVDDRVLFVNSDGDIELEGHWDSNWGRLSIYLPYNGGTFDFQREDAASSFFYPQAKDILPTRVPMQLDDGWTTGSLQDAEMEATIVSQLIERIDSTPMNAIDAPQVHAFLIARNGKLVFEEYFHGFTRTQTHATRSASKTVTALLTGAAEYRSEMPRTSLVLPILNEHGYTNGDDRASRMTIEHLISMTPGLDCNDWDDSSAGGEDRMQSQDVENDWVRYMMDLPMKTEPGTLAAYCSGSQHLAGRVLAIKTGAWLPDYFYKYVARPLQITEYQMNLSPIGEAYGGGGLYIRPRDFLKIGQLFLNNGLWNGTRVLSPEWIRDAVSARNNIGDEGYGYGWWVFSYPHKGETLDAYYAGGNGGQYIIVVPALDLVIGIFGGNYSQRVQHVAKYEYVPEYVLSAIR